MGVYNTLHVVAPCPACGENAERAIQFKYGDSRMNNFRLDQQVGWDVNVRGKPWHGVTLTSGVANACSICSTEFLEYVIELRGDTIAGV